MTEDNQTTHVAGQLRRQLYFWLIVAVIFGLFLYVFRSILLPFVAGMVIAYMLDPVADRLERLGMSRTWATVTILVLFVAIFVMLLIIVVPILARQLVDFIERLPSLVSQLQTLLASMDFAWFDKLSSDGGLQIRDNLNEWLKQGSGVISGIVQSLWSSGLAVINIASLFVVTPVVVFYMLLDWDHMVAKVDSWLPRPYVNDVREIATDINSAIAGFLRGQATVCIVLGLFYATLLSLVGLNYGMLIGMSAGFISFIPYVGSLVGFALSIGVALVQFWPDWIMIAIVCAVFGAGQFLEGNILQPKLVGTSVGLHPVWLMFALFAFGSLFGFVGMLIAVPAAAACAVVTRFALKRYLNSPLYNS